MNLEIGPATLRDQRIVCAYIGWHVSDDTRTESIYTFQLSDGRFVTPKTGARFWLEAGAAVRSDFDMDEYGRYEFRIAEPEHLVTSAIGKNIVQVDEIVWTEHVVGIVVHFDEGVLVVADIGDEVFFSNGALPSSYRDVVIRAAP